MEAYLQTKELWEYVDGTLATSVPVDTTRPTPSEQKDILDWKRKAGRASGEIWLAIEDDQKVHVKECKGDPAKM